MVTDELPTTRPQLAFNLYDGLVHTRIVKRICVLLIELLTEALLLGGLLGVMVSTRIGFIHGLLGSILALPVILALHGYYISRALGALTWSSKAKWFYPAIAALAFFGHVLFTFSVSKSDFSTFAQALFLPFLVSGSGSVFLCAFVWNQLAKRWSQVTSSHRSQAV